MRNATRWIRFHFKLIHFLLAIGLSLFGSFQVYHGVYSNPLKELTVILYATFQLFMFSPTNAVIKEAPLAYELAIWIAPAFTMVGFFSIFEPAFRKLKLFLCHVGWERLLLLGANEDAIIFVEHLRQEEPDTRVLLLLDPTDDVNRERFERFGVAVQTLDFTASLESHERTLSWRRGWSIDRRIVSFAPEPENVARIAALGARLATQEEKRYDVYLKTSSERFVEIMEPKMDEISIFDIHYFQTDALLIKQLFEASTFAFAPQEGMRQDWTTKSITCA